MKQPKPTSPGGRWRLHAQHGREAFSVANRLALDELVVAGGAANPLTGKLDGAWLHIERMGDRDWWMSIGDVAFSISLTRSGRVRVRVAYGARYLAGIAGPQNAGGAAGTTPPAQQRRPTMQTVSKTSAGRKPNARAVKATGVRR